MSKKKIALAQMTSTHDLSSNFSTASLMIKDAAGLGADLVAFPENFLFLGSDKKCLELSQELNGELIHEFSKMAQQHNLSLLLGSFLEKNPNSPGKCFNTSVLIDKRGGVVATYRKIHLFDVQMPDVNLLESRNFAPGESLTVVDHEIGKVGLSICYDLRFPCLYQLMTRAGAEIVFVPAAFTKQTGHYHWLTLLKARAIENQVYIAAPAQVGQHNKNRESFGKSVLIDPWGEVLVMAEDKPGLIMGEIDLEYLKKIRRGMPILSHRIEGIDH